MKGKILAVNGGLFSVAKIRQESFAVWNADSGAVYRKRMRAIAHHVYKCLIRSGYRQYPVADIRLNPQNTMEIYKQIFTYWQ